MKKVLIAVMVLGLFLTVNLQANAQMEVTSGQTISEQVKEIPQNMVGFDFPNYGWAMTNEKGEITGYRGFNLALGYSQKNYYNAGLKTNEWNNFWGWGTTILVIPYAEIGTDYVFEPNHKGDFWTVGASVGVYNLMPTPRLSVSYHF